MKRKLGLAGLALALGLFVAACGGGGGGDRLSKADYLAKVQAVGAEMNKTLSGLGSTSSDPKLAAEQFGKLKVALKAAADELAALKPPAEVDSAHKQFAEGISLLADEIGKASTVMAGGDLKAALEFVTNLAKSPAMAKVQAAVAEFKKAGYDVSK
jgi:soluble cytochrome b562